MSVGRSTEDGRGRGVYWTGLRPVVCTPRALDGVLVDPMNPRVKLQCELF